MTTVTLTNAIVCANWTQDNQRCKKIGQFACKGCLLVLYCGGDCQQSHWAKHKRDCRDNPLLKPNWKPEWERQCRSPYFLDFVGERYPEPFNYQKKYLWGNVPAFDLLKLPSNEGINYSKDLNLLFAASGDFRNVVKTIASIPDEYKNAVNVYMNDRDGDVVSRNAIMLLLALTEEDPLVAAENIIHLWYSAFITQSLQNILKGKIRELVQDVCTKIEGKPSCAVLGKTWTFGRSSLRLVLAKKQWLDLLACLEPPPGLTIEKALLIRRDVTLAPQRVDYRERIYLTKPPGDRASHQKYREEGVLVPFGAPRALFIVPNPTLFRDTNRWPLTDDSDPTSGWHKHAILEVWSGAAKNDIYAKLSFLLRDLLVRFHQRLRNSAISFQLLHFDAEDIYKHVKDTLFDRIEVSNISDAGYLGMGLTLVSIGLLLKPLSQNPHATVVALFINAVQEMIDATEQEKILGSEIDQVKQYIEPKMPKGRYDAMAIITLLAAEHVRDVDKYFDRYMKRLRFADLAHETGMEPKKRHTIIDPWPTRVQKKAHQKGGREEFATLLSSAHSGCERYMEWQWSRS